MRFLSCLFGCLVFCLAATVKGETLLKIAAIQTSSRTERAVDQWAKEINARGLPNIHVLIKESEEGVFSDREKETWLSKKTFEEADLARRNWSWKPTVHGAQIVWQTEQSLGCVVHVPSQNEYTHATGTLPKEWIVWHELSHCIWPMNGLKEEWWQLFAKTSGIGLELSEMQEESWSDAWAVWLSKKHLNLPDAQIIGWMRSRTEEALKCKCLGHWTNATVSFGLAAFEEAGGSAWEDVEAWMRNTTLQAEDLEWLKWQWINPRKKTPSPSNLWLKNNGSILTTGAK